MSYLDEHLFPTVKYATSYNLGINVPNKEKEMNSVDKTKPFAVGGVKFTTEDEALDYAKVLVKKWEVDVAVYKIVSVVKFPIPDYTVETVA